jgi:hypothetical protein
LDKRKALEDKAKALLALQKEHYLKAEQTLLQWKLDPAGYVEHSNKKNIQELEEP